MLRQLNVFIFVMIVVVSTSCDIRHLPSSTGKNDSDMRLNKPREVSYPYEMPSARKKEFFERLKNVRVGEKYSEVTKAFGQPDYVYEISAMEREGPQGLLVTYWIKKLRNGVNEKYDQVVELEFDMKETLVKLWLHNIEIEEVHQFRNVPVSKSKWDDVRKTTVISGSPQKEFKKCPSPSTVDNQHEGKQPSKPE